VSSQDKNLPYEILTLSHLGFKYCSVCTYSLSSVLTDVKTKWEIFSNFLGILRISDLYLVKGKIKRTIS
jgi:hypothetical protein